MQDKSIGERIRAEFVRNFDKMLERDIRRLTSAGDIEFDAFQYLMPAERFASIMREHCAVVERAVDLGEFDRWYRANDYRKLFPDYCKTYTDDDLLKKKAFEHWLSIEETRDAPPGVFLDVGCATSPFSRLWADMQPNPAEIVYRVDLPLPEYGFRPGVNGNIIGCPADAIPLADSSVARMYSHNAIEHFEGAAYVGLFREAARLLQPGGVMYVCPLFVATETFSFVSLTGIYRRLHFPSIIKGTKLIYSDVVGQPYSLYVDASFLVSRIIDPLTKELEFTLTVYPEEVERVYEVGLGLSVRRRP